MEANGGIAQSMDGAPIRSRIKKGLEDASIIGTTNKMVSKEEAQITAAIIVAMIETITHPTTMMMEEETEGQSEP